MKKHSLAALFLTAFLLCSAIFAAADIGNYNRYDDYGSTDFNSGSGGGTGFPFFIGSPSPGEEDGGVLPYFLIGAAVFIVVIILIKKSSKAPPDPNQYRPPVTRDLTDRTADISARLSRVDPEFSAELFFAFVKETYLSLQNAWMEKNLETIRLLESPELFNQHKTQLEEYIKLGRKNIVERIAVNDIYLTDFSSDEAGEHLKVFLSVVLRDYIIEEKTGKVIAGRADMDSRMKYLLTFSRSKGALTQPGAGVNAVSCPNCGAPAQTTAAGKCVYCGSLFTSDRYPWVLSDMRRA